MTRNSVVTSADNPALEKSYKIRYKNFCQHLVCLGVRATSLDEHGRSDGHEYLTHYTFFVASTEDQWFLVSAGHVFIDLNNQFTDSRIHIFYTFLADFFGTQGVENIPLAFDYPNSSPVFLDDPHGVDFGFIPVSEQLKANLQANNITPISELHWTRTTDPTIREYWMLGFPADINQQRNPPIRSGTERKGVAIPIMVSLDQIEPCEVPATIAGWETDIPRFIGRINCDIPFQIEGMSGGPIFGLCETPMGLDGYTVVALQSSWDSQTRTIFACPIRVFGELLLRHVRGE